MRKLLLPLLAAVVLPTAVNANVDIEIHKLCKDVKDYMGCVQANKMESSSKNSMRSKWYSNDNFEGKLIKPESSTKSNGDIKPITLPGDEFNPRETFVHRGKTYKASRNCPKGENMYWQYDFSGVWEIGCMSIKEYESYARDFNRNRRQNANRIFQDSLKNFSNTINPPTTRCSTYGSGSSLNTTCKQY